MLSSRYAKMLCRLAEHSVLHSHAAKAQQHSTALYTMIAQKMQNGNYIMQLQQKSCEFIIFDKSREKWGFCILSCVSCKEVPTFEAVIL